MSEPQQRETKVAALVGPTAVGKSSAALDLAVVLGAEIVSVDSMQIYRGMDIGTDKVSAEARDRVPHHLLDLKNPSEEITVSEFRDLAREAIADISARGKLPLLVGGSGLYFRAIVDELRFPPTSAAVRERLTEEIKMVGAAAMHRQLSEVDPAAADKVEPNNARRIVRALEVIELTGQPFSSNTSWGDYQSRYRLAVAGLALERSTLFDRIGSRIDEMFSKGLLGETTNLGRLSQTARQALGYKQILDSPSASEAELRTEIVRGTKRFARRQESWFRSDPRIRWFEAADEGLQTDLVDFFRSRLDIPT